MTMNDRLNAALDENAALKTQINHLESKLRDRPLQVINQVCKGCDDITSFHYGLRKNSEGMPEEFECCLKCGFDYVTDGIVPR